MMTKMAMKEETKKQRKRKAKQKRKRRRVRTGMSRKIWGIDMFEILCF